MYKLFTLTMIVGQLLASVPAAAQTSGSSGTPEFRDPFKTSKSGEQANSKKSSNHYSNANSGDAAAYDTRPSYHDTDAKRSANVRAGAVKQ